MISARPYVIAACLCGIVAMRSGAQSNSQTAPVREVRLVRSVGDPGQQTATLVTTPVAVTVAANGTIWVSESARIPGAMPQGRVRLFDSIGKVIRTIDGFVTASVLTPDDSGVVAKDFSMRRITAFTFDGTKRRAGDMREEEIGTTSTTLHGGRALVVSEAIPRAGRTDEHWRPFTTITVRTPQSSRIDTLFEIRQDRAWNEPGKIWLGARFGAAGAVACSGDSIVVIVDGYRGEATWYTASVSGLSPGRVERLGTAQTVTSDDIAASEAWMRTRAVGVGGGGGGPPVRFVQTPPLWSVADQAVFSSDGSLWVHIPGRERFPQTWRVFPADERAYTVRFPTDFKLEAVRGRRVFGLAASSSGGGVVQIYEVGSS